MNNSKKRQVERARRSSRIRKTLKGSTERPRLAVRRSLNHIYAQIIDDINGKTIVHVGSTGKEFAQKIAGKENLKKSDISRIVGEMIAERALEKGVSKVVFDRKGYQFHGRVKALADAARGKGLVF